ncbi:MAG TPA: ribosome maturation factor RimM [Vicinamibacterales bacterium]|nr:ribosome maturation factor RimM [Vicinamibacterales bacterium]
MTTGLILVGRVARAHGNRGEVIVNLETDFAEARFRQGAVMQVCTVDACDPRRIEAVRFHQGRPVVAFAGITTMTAAEALAGAELKLPEAELGPLPPATFYRHDLVGCDVVTVQGESLGRVARVEGPMARSCLVVAGQGRGELLIPLVEPICVDVDPPGRRIVVDPPEGLIDLNEGSTRTSGGE